MYNYHMFEYHMHGEIYLMTKAVSNSCLSLGEQAVRLGRRQNMPRPTLTFDLLILKSVWESHVTWGTPVQSFVFLGLLVFELEPMYRYATSDRQTDRRRTPMTA